MNYLNCLPKRDLISLLEIANEFRRVKDKPQFRSCFQKLKTMLLCDGGFCVYADKEALDNRQVPIFYSQTLDFSDDFLRQYVGGRYHENSSVIHSIFETWEPQHWQSTWSGDSDGIGFNSMQMAKQYGYLDGWTHANSHPNNSAVTVITFAGKKVEKDQRTKTILKYITPHLAESLSSTFNSRLIQGREIARFSVTPRELEILKWLENGKSTWDISVILSRSERVIKWHVKNLMKKLSTLNRTHTVAIGLRLGLLE